MRGTMVGRNTLAASLLAAFIASALAGCFAAPDAAAYRVVGTDGKGAIGFAYDGHGVLPFDGNITIDVEDVNNTGQVVVHGAFDGRQFDVVFDRFNGLKDFHDGGIVSGLREHGDSGVGDTSVPAVDLDVAGWGTARVTVDGEPLIDPVNGTAEWAAHFMVVRNGFRDDDTGTVWNGDRSGPYDPDVPGDATTVDGDWEIHLALRTTDPSGGPATAYHEFDSNGEVNSPAYAETHAFEARPGSARVIINATNYSPTGTQTMDLDFVLSSPSGEELESASASPDFGETVMITWDVNLTEDGEFTVDVSGSAVQGTYNVDVHVTNPAVAYNFWWEDVSFS